MLFEDINMKYIAVFVLFCSAVALPRLGVNPAEKVERGKAPFVVSLQFCFLNICESDCTGVILNKNLILTSAWCAKVHHYQVSVGVTNLPDDNGDAQQAVAGKSIFHPKYDSVTGLNDIAIIKLLQPLQLGKKAQAVVLPKQNEAPSAKPAEFYGYNTRLLMKGPLSVSRNQKIISQSDCNELVKKSGISLNLKTSICTASAATGEGDRGGPLVQNGVVIGIVGQNTTDGSSAHGFSVFTPTNLYVDWINEVIKSNM